MVLLADSLYKGSGKKDCGLLILWRCATQKILVAMWEKKRGRQLTTAENQPEKHQCGVALDGEVFSLCRPLTVHDGELSASWRKYSAIAEEEIIQRTWYTAER